MHVYESCEITGNLTINGDPTGVLWTGVWLNCAVDGNLTDNAGMLVLAIIGARYRRQCSDFPGRAPSLSVPAC